MDITKIDHNFKVTTTIHEEGLSFHNCLEAPFVLRGAIYEDGAYRRIPQAIADSISEGVSNLNLCSAGGRIEFATDSPYIALHVEVNVPNVMSHFAITGSVGCDLYRKSNGETIYLGTFVPAVNIGESMVFEGCLGTGLGSQGRGLRSWGRGLVNGLRIRRSLTPVPKTSTPVPTYIINLPTYSGATAIYVGVHENSILASPSDYTISKPVVFYGSSITQGGCTSRPGCTYEAQLSRALDFDYINLGFSGSALAEDRMIDYINSLDMSVFVMDYDHNAPDADYLQTTHEHFYRKIRQKHPALPIIMMSMPKYRLSTDDLKRKAIIVETYEKAKSGGDSNVFLLTGEELIPEEMADIALVDNCHPNDAGFYSMARALHPIMKEALGL